jgi:UDP-N-acetylmuramoyl-tripeptide--D-alanyl-D-alanine ligase
LGNLCVHSSHTFAGARHFETMAALQEAVVSHMPGCSSVVIKGSRFMKMERVVESLRVLTASAQATERGSVHAA